MPHAFDFNPEYIVIGSGAGGGTVAARLAEAGYRVLVLEAGPDPASAPAASRRSNADDYDVPAFHPFATENAAMRWDFFVRHYSRRRRSSGATRTTGRRGMASRSTACCIRAPVRSAAAPRTTR